MNSTGTILAVLDASNQVHFRPVCVERDFGSEVGIASGLTFTDLVVTNPGERLADGAQVAFAIHR